MKRFALIGASGYIAPKHMEAIYHTKNDLVAALDPSDSVGIIDNHFPRAQFFTEFERFDRFIDKLRRKKMPIDYVSICSPNYLHDSHIRFALRSGANVICEKPLVLNPWNLNSLKDIESETGCTINTILQLRIHPSVLELKETVKHTKKMSKYDVNLTYITSRGAWYLQSWKGDEKKSGGITTNIGIHLFDMLHFVFGKPLKSYLHLNEKNKSSGYMETRSARIKWFLSIDEVDIPSQIRGAGKRTFRSIKIDGQEMEFSDGFTDLHSQSYELILNNKGFKLEDNQLAIQTVSDLRKAEINKNGEMHELMLKRYSR